MRGALQPNRPPLRVIQHVLKQKVHYVTYLYVTYLRSDLTPSSMKEAKALLGRAWARLVLEERWWRRRREGGGDPQPDVDPAGLTPYRELRAEASSFTPADLAAKVWGWVLWEVWGAMVHDEKHEELKGHELN